MKKNIAVIFGGRSAEHDVSIITAHIPIIESLIASGQYEVWPVYITKEGDWYCDQVMNNLQFFKQSGYQEQLSKMKKVQLSLNDGLQLIWPGLRAKTLKLDVVFPSMHGTYGEDGSLMGVLRLAGVPFVGCDIFASAVAMDKVLTKQVVAQQGVPVASYVWFTKSEWEQNSVEIKEKISKLSYPLFIKPVHLGSSIGISKAKDEKELLNGIEVALHYDEKVLVEEGVQNLYEVTLPVIGNDELQFGGIEHPLNKTEFFDFNDKYIGGGKKSGGVNAQYSEIPAKIDEAQSELVKKYATMTYKALGCSGLCRVDFLIDSLSKKVYVNEVNTLPGSLYEHNWRKMGVSRMELVTKLVDLAFERFEKQKSITYAFQTDILKQIGGSKFQGNS